MKNAPLLLLLVSMPALAAPPYQNDIACRLAAGTGPVTGCGASDIATEVTPTSGDWALGWDASGALRKYDLSALLGGGGSSVTFGGATYTDLAAGSNVTFSADGDGTATINVSSGSATVGDGDYGDITISGSGAAWAVDSGAVAFSELSGAATDAQIPDNITVDLATVATTANSGDSATAFFSAGTIEAVRLPALSTLGGSVTDAQVPNDITVDLATVATTANAGDSATAFFSAGTIEAARLPDLSGTYQPLNANLTSIAELTTTSFGRGLLEDVDASAGRASLGVAIGTNVQAYDSDLTTWAGVTPGTGVTTALAQTANAGAGVVTADQIGALSSGTAPPSTAPAHVGDLFVDTSGQDLYFAVGTSSSADWIQANN